jgi:peptidoglycan/xylan/chitin deacetylase (PgdA/CDA1 family)
MFGPGIILCIAGLCGLARHEIGMHGWIREVASSLSMESERELMLRTADTIERITGKRPVGLRTPAFDVSPSTLHIARKMGIRHDSSLMADENCYELLLDGHPSGIIELPADWVRDDGAYLWTERFGGLRPYTTPEGVFGIFRRELDAAFEEGGLFQLIMHPHDIGVGRPRRAKRSWDVLGR